MVGECRDSLVGEKSICENPEQICYELIFAVMYCIRYVCHHVQNPLSNITADFSYSTLNFVLPAARF